MLDSILADPLMDGRLPIGLGGHWYGVHPALVTDIKDPDGQGRVRISLPWSADTKGDRYEAWARMATLMGGNNRGSWFIPDVNDEVLIAFEAGDPRRPYVIGGLWNGRDKAPESMDGGGRNLRKVVRSRNGVRITLDDSRNPGRPKGDDEGWTGIDRGRRQQRQFGEIRNRRNHRECSGESDNKCRPG